MKTRYDRLKAQEQKLEGKLKADPDNAVLKARLSEIQSSIKNYDEHGHENGPPPPRRPMDVHIGERRDG